jgi:hypothetical protein
VRFRWLPDDPTTEYRITVTDGGNTLLLERTVLGSTLMIPSAAIGVNRGKMYFWTLYGSGTERHSSAFMLADDRTTVAVNEELRRTASLPIQDEAAQHILKAAVYDEHECYANALNEYACAARIDSSPELRDLVANFLMSSLKMDQNEAMYCAEMLSK